MGYEIDFRVKKLPEKYENTRKEEPEDMIKELKAELMSFCMNAGYKAKNEQSYGLYKTLKFRVAMIRSIIFDKWKWDLKERLEKDNNEMYYCGWEFSHDSNDSATVEECEDSFLDRLYLITSSVPTPDYFTDRDNFYEKYDNLKEEADEYFDDLYYQFNLEFFYDIKDNPEYYETIHDDNDIDSELSKIDNKFDNDEQ